MGTVKMVPPDDVHGNARAVIVDRGSDAERYWRERGYFTEEELAGTGTTAVAGVDMSKLAQELQENSPGPLSTGHDQSDAMKVHAEQEAKGEPETSVEKGEGAPGIVGQPASGIKTTPDIDPDAPDHRPVIGRTALGFPTKPPDVALGTTTATGAAVTADEPEARQDARGAKSAPKKTEKKADKKA